MLLCNIINTLESLNLIFERINDFNLNLNSPVQLFLISFVTISIIVKFSGAFYASNIEIFLSKKNKEKNKELSNLVFLFVVIVFCNEMFTLENTFSICEFLILIIMLFCIGVLKVIQSIKNSKETKLLKKLKDTKLLKKLNTSFIERNKQNCFLVIILVFFPLVISAFSNINKTPKISLTILGTLVETILIFLISNGLRMNYSNIKIVKFDDEQEKYYLLAKIDDKKIICGDKNTINDSSKLITIDVEDILNKTYYMVSEKNGITLTSKNE